MFHTWKLQLVLFKCWLVLQCLQATWIEGYTVVKWLSGFCYLKLPAVVKLCALLTDWNSSQVELKDATPALPTTSRPSGSFRDWHNFTNDGWNVSSLYHIPPTNLHRLSLFLVVSLPLCPSLVLSISHSIPFPSHILSSLSFSLSLHLTSSNMLSRFTLCPCLQYVTDPVLQVKSYVLWFSFIDYTARDESNVCVYVLC